MSVPNPHARACLTRARSAKEVHPAAKAYVRKLSIRDNVMPHARQRFLLKLDFKDFFPSIKADDLRVFLETKNAPFEKAEVDALCRILFWTPKGTADLCLSIGAPTSPMLSNVLMVDFDETVANTSALHNVTYTRYADDLSFSARDSMQLAEVEKAVRELCERSKSPALVINNERTVRVSKRDARKVTGLTLTNDGPVSLGRDTKRQIRASMHHFTTNRLTPEQILQLRGLLAYVNSVEPEFLKRLGTPTVKMRSDDA